ncbi:MAG: L-serine ammonia-lyase, iron-sulfur-dependent, subunit alpha [Coriobacteriia bacterium]|nr:L-serine ammonia-lyase, iron-sulfur-dependent, subunit alpha [Coriobacteriia bacterium]
MAYASFSGLLKAAEEQGSLAKAILELEALESGTTTDEVRAHMAQTLKVMREAIAEGSNPTIKSRTGLTGGDGARLLDTRDRTRPLGGLFARALGSAVATAEVNAAMGRIVAAPTAGASGVVPGVLLSVAAEYGKSDDEIIDALFVSAGIGGVFAARATLSGAAGGCQAEIGTGASMAAGAVTSLLGGNPEQVGHAASLAMQGLLGLVCDPVAGLVEIPCVVRNATGAAVALAGAEMALAGVVFPIPLDEVVGAAARVGAAISPNLRETARGGLAITPTGLDISKRNTL